jgi:hypothetical protein
VVFKRPFSLAGIGGVMAAGSYLVETAEELVEGLSFAAWRRQWTSIRLPPSPGSAFHQIATVDAASLDAAIALDAADPAIPTGVRSEGDRADEQ